MELGIEIIGTVCGVDIVFTDPAHNEVCEHFGTCIRITLRPGCYCGSRVHRQMRTIVQRRAVSKYASHTAKQALGHHRRNYFSRPLKEHI